MSAAQGARDVGYNYLMMRVLEIKPRLAKLSPKTQAALDAFRARQKAMQQPRKICTKEAPMPQVYRASDNWFHPDAKFHDRDGDFHDLHKCPNCGLIICVEIRNTSI